MIICPDCETPGATAFSYRWFLLCPIDQPIHVQVTPENADKIVVMENLLYVILIILGFVAVALYFSINRDLDD
jgi:hypothetical protein